MNRESIAQLRGKLALIGQQAKGLILRVPPKARIVLGLFLIAAIFMAIYTALTAKDSMLHVKVQHGFHNAQVSVWVDGDLAYSGTTSGAVKKKFGFLPSDAVQGSLSQMIPVHSGQHAIRVRVAPDDASAQDDTTTGDFARNSERELLVAARHSGLSLSWQGGGAAVPDAPSSSFGWMSRYAGSLLLSIAGSIISALTGFAIRELPGRLRSASDAAPKGGGRPAVTNFPALDVSCFLTVLFKLQGMNLSVRISTIPLMHFHRTGHLALRNIVLALLLANAALAVTNTQVVVVPVANMYSRPSDKSDVVSQAIYGSNVKLLVASGEWSRIQTDDHYKGWIPSRHLRVILSGNGYAASGAIVQVDSLFANVYNEPDVTRHKPVVTIPFGARLDSVTEKSEAANQATANHARANNATANQTVAKESHEGWIQVYLPDRRNAWIQASDVVADPKPMSIPESIELGKRFLGLPYLWGGRSSFGFDCSGFTQMLVRARGINMPRDADQQAAWSGVAPVERKDLQPGDLLFFGASAKSIVHTGMYIGDGQFIQDTTNGRPVVQISRLDDDPWTKLLVACRRIKVK